MYAFNDEYAFFAIEALEASGHEVPGDVAVMGCDDSAAARRTKLTTIALGDPHRWELVGERLHALIEGAEDRTPIFGTPSVVPGVTT